MLLGILVRRTQVTLAWRRFGFGLAFGFLKFYFCHLFIIVYYYIYLYFLCLIILILLFIITVNYVVYFLRCFYSTLLFGFNFDSLPTPRTGQP